MRVAIATENGFVSAHFGRCSTYTLYDIENKTITSQLEIENPGHQPGFLPRFLAEKGVNVIIAGGMGPRAQDLFTQNGIKNIRGVQGALDDVIQAFLKDELRAGEDLCSHPQDHGDCQQHNEDGPEDKNEIRGPVVCMTAEGKELDSQVDPRFGRAAFFQFYDTGSGTLEAVANECRALNQGAGIQAAQLIVKREVSTLITGECGPKAGGVLNAAGVHIITGATGTIGSWVDKMKKEG